MFIIFILLFKGKYVLPGPGAESIPAVSGVRFEWGKDLELLDLNLEIKYFPSLLIDTGYL